MPLLSTAIASRVATDSRKWTSSSLNVRRRAVCAPITPNALPCPATATVTPLTTLCSINSGEARKRVSFARSSTTTGSPAVSVKPACVCGSVGTVAWPTNPSFQPTPARSSIAVPSGCSSSRLQYSTSRVCAASTTAWLSRAEKSSLIRASWPRALTTVCCRERVRSVCSARSRSRTRSSNDWAIESNARASWPSSPRSLDKPVRLLKSPAPRRRTA